MGSVLRNAGGHPALVASLHVQMLEVVTFVAIELRGVMAGMAVGAPQLALMGLVGVGLQTFRLGGDRFVADVASQADAHRRATGRCLISVAIGAGQANASMRTLNFLGRSIDGKACRQHHHYARSNEGPQSKNPANPRRKHVGDLPHRQEHARMWRWPTNGVLTLEARRRGSF